MDQVKHVQKGGEGVSAYGDLHVDPDRWKPPVQPGMGSHLWLPSERTCRQCGAVETTTSRNFKWCSRCRVEKYAESTRRSRKRKRKAGRKE